MSRSVQRPFGPRFLIPGMCAALVLTTLWVYRHSLDGTFIFDDVPNIVENGSLTELWPAEVPFGLERRPVGRFTFALNYAWDGLNVWRYHAVNLVIHVAAGLVLFDLVRRTLMLDPLRTRYGEAAAYLAFAVAMIWTLHPLGTQSVAYIVQRLESLMGLFYLSCLYCVLRGSQSSRRGWWYTAAVVVFWLGVGTKEVMVTAALVVPLFDRVFLSDSWTDLFRRRGPVYAAFLPALAAMGVAMTPSFSAQANQGAGFGYKAVSPLEYLGTQPGVILHYLRLAFWPNPLCFDYQWPVATSRTEIFLPGAVVMALLTTSLVLLYFRPRIGFLGLSFFLILAPTSSFMPIKDLAVEHRMYLPLAVLVVLVVMLAYEAWNRRRGHFRAPIVPAAGAAIVAVVLGNLAMERTKDYHSETAIWADTVRKRPNNPRAYYNLGHAYQEETRFDLALANYNEALRLRPDYAEAIQNRGGVYQELGQTKRAMADYTRAIELRPANPNPYHNLALIYRRMGDYDRAVHYSSIAIELTPDRPKPYYDRGYSHLMLREYELAIRDFTSAIRLDPNYAEAYSNRANALQQSGENDRALEDYGRAIKLDPANPNPFHNRATLYRRLGKSEFAIRDYGEAARRFYRSKQYAQAWAEVTRVRELGGDLHPQFINALTAAAGQPMAP